MIFKTPFILVLLVLFSGCATWSNRTKAIVSSVGAGLVVGTIAANLAPEDEKPLAHGALWGGPTAAAVGIISQFVFDEQKKSEEWERQLEVLKKELDVYRNPRLEGNSSLEGVPAFPKQIPNSLTGLVDPGSWKYTRLPQNTWRWHGSHAVVRECEKFEFIPPRLRLGFPTEELGTREAESHLKKGEPGESPTEKNSLDSSKKENTRKSEINLNESEKKEIENEIE